MVPPLPVPGKSLGGRELAPVDDATPGSDKGGTAASSDVNNNNSKNIMCRERVRCADADADGGGGAAASMCGSDLMLSPSLPDRKKSCSAAHTLRTCGRAGWLCTITEQHSDGDASTWATSAGNCHVKKRCGLGDALDGLFGPSMGNVLAGDGTAATRASAETVPG